MMNNEDAIGTATEIDVARMAIVDGCQGVREMVSTFTCHGDMLIVGTTDGSLLSYVIEQNLRAKLVVKKALGRGKHRVEKVTVIAALSQLGVLCDGRLDILDLRSLENLSSLTLPKHSSSVTGALGSSPAPAFFNFCVGLMSAKTRGNGRPSVSAAVDDVRDVRIVGLSRKRIVAYQLPEVGTPVKDIQLAEQPQGGAAMLMRAGFVYLVYKRSYVRLSLFTDELVPLMTFNGRATSMALLPSGVLCSSDQQSRLIPYPPSSSTAASSSSITASSSSGSVATPTTTTTSDGTTVSNEGGEGTGGGDVLSEPVHWPSTPLSLSYREPYVLALLSDGVAIYHATAQRHYQTVALPADLSPMLNDDGHRPVIFGPATGFSHLIFNPAESQVRDLLLQRRVDEALSLFACLAGGEADFKRRMLNVRRDAGFALFAAMQFQMAFTFWLDSSVHPFDILECFPDLLSLSNPCFQNRDAHDGIRTQMPRPDVVVVLHEHLPPKTSQDSKRRHLEQAQQLLITFLEHYAVSPRGLSPFDLQMLNLVLLKLYLDMQPEKLLSFITSETSLPFDDAQLCLKAKHFYHALGRLCEASNQPREALEYWRQLGLGQLQDREPRVSINSALNSTISLLGRIADQTLVWEYSGWVLDTEPTLGINIFLSALRPKEAALQPDQVLEFLSSRDKSLRLLYLEHLTSAAAQSESRYHTKLAMLYLDNIIPALLPSVPTSSSSSASSSSSISRSGVDGLREKLLKFLETSNSYDYGVVLARIRDLSLYDEQVVLHSKLGQHSIALRIIMEKFHDRARAEAYCEKHERQDPNIFVELLKLYAQDTSQTGSPDPATVRFINHIGHKLSFKEVLKMYPDLPVGKVLPYLKASLQHFHHSRLEDQIEHNLLRANRIALHAKLIECQRQRAVVTPETKCCHCRKEIGDRVFLRYPHGALVHFKCYTEGR